MAFTFSTQAQIAFKNILGKSHTDTQKGVVNEFDGISLNVTSDNIWLDSIYSSASASETQGTALKVIADLSPVYTSNGHAFYTMWPSVVPSGSDIKTGLPFAYGVGSLVGVTGGMRITNLIPDGYGFDYQPVPYTTYPSGPILPLDPRVWFYQYNSGILYQENKTYTSPTKIQAYVYIGNKLANLNTQQNIRVTALGTNSYYSNTSSPIISTYSSNYLFLVNFVNTNTSGTVSLNINNIGTASVYKYDQTGPIPLLPGDITGANGATAGPIYYLTYSDGVFQFYKSNPVQNASSYTNPLLTSNRVGNITQGSSFDNVLIQDMFSDLLYPEQLGTINSFSLNAPNSFEVGASFSPGSYDFNWTISGTNSFATKSCFIEDVSISTPSGPSWGVGSTIVTGYTNSAPYTYVLSSTISSTITRSRTYRLSLKRKNGTTISMTYSIPWKWKIYYGTSTASQVLPEDVPSLGGTLSSTPIGNWIIPGSGYKYLALPFEATYSISTINYQGLPVAMADTQQGYTLTDNGLGYQLIFVTNSFGVGSFYKIYRTMYPISGTFTMTITN